MKKENKENFIKKVWKKIPKKIKLIIVAVVVAITFSGFFALKNFNLFSSLSSEYVSGKLSRSSELTTAKLNYTGMSEFKDKGIKFINRSDFTMIYHSTARAGINMKDVKVRVNDQAKTVHITVPKARVLDVKVDPKSIKYFNTSFALINPNEKEDASEAQALAEQEAKKEVAKMGILELADEQSETLIKGILEGSVKDYKIEVRKK